MFTAKKEKAEEMENDEKGNEESLLYAARVCLNARHFIRPWLFPYKASQLDLRFLLQTETRA